MVRLVLGLVLAIIASDAMGVSLRGGRISGVVVDARSGRPVAGAIAVAHWRGYYGDGRGDVCIRSVAVRADSAGRFEMPAWIGEHPLGDRVSFTTTAYAPGRILGGLGSSHAALRPTSLDDIRVADTVVRLQMVESHSDPVARSGDLAHLMAGIDCHDGDARGARALYAAIRAEAIAMPPEAVSYRSTPDALTLVEIVDRTLASLDRRRGLIPRPLPAAP